MGRVSGGAALGLYSRAHALLLAPRATLANPLARVAHSALSRLQDQPERYRRFYQRAVLPPIFFGMPLVAFVFITADALVFALLGPDWTGVVPIFRLMAPAAFLATFNHTTSWVFTSVGHVDRQLRWAGFSAGFRVLAMGIGAFWGVYGIAAAVSVAAIGLRLPLVLYCYKSAPLVPADLGRVLWRPALASLLAALVLDYLLAIAPLPDAELAILSLALVAYATIYILLWLILPGGARVLRDNFTLLRQLLSSAKDSG